MSAQQCSDFVSSINKKESDKFKPAVVILDNIHSQGSKIMQILSRLETSTDETPVIICTSQQTEYLTDVLESFNFAKITLGDDVEVLQAEMVKEFFGTFQESVFKRLTSLRIWLLFVSWQTTPQNNLGGLIEIQYLILSKWWLILVPNLVYVPFRKSPWQLWFQGLLGRYLRRKMLNLEVTTKLANLDMPEAIQWLQRIYCNLYIFVKTTSQTQSFLSPSVFMQCPVETSAQLR